MTFQKWISLLLIICILGCFLTGCEGMDLELTEPTESTTAADEKEEEKEEDKEEDKGDKEKEDGEKEETPEITDALTIGNHKITNAELNYFYIDAISSFCNSYKYYLSYILNVSTPLNEQIHSTTTGQTWADFFLETAIDNAVSAYALYDEAVKQGFQLSAEEQATLDNLIPNLEETIDYYCKLYESAGMEYPYKDAASYLKNTYGNISTTESYKQYYEVCFISSNYYTYYHDHLEYTDADLRAYEQDIRGNYSSHSYTYYQFVVSDFLQGGTKGDDGKVTYTDEEKKAARETAKNLAENLAAGTYADADDFDVQLHQLLRDYGDLQVNDEKVLSTTVTEQLGTRIPELMNSWITSTDRREGDITVIPRVTGSGDDQTVAGYYVVRYNGVNENLFQLVNVRHILAKFEGGTYNSMTGHTTYTEAEKKAAKVAAEKLLEQWQAGDATEESFAELANKESDDGDGTTGGLYTYIYPGQMVANFNDWCFDENRKPGDYGIVETEYGYHVMYFSGLADINYRDYLITNDVRNEDTNNWHTALIEDVEHQLLTDEYVNKAFVISH